VSKRLQVIVDDEEMSSFEQTARAHGLTVSEWVRQSLRATERATSHRDPDEKIRAIRAATLHRFPAGDITSLLEEIEQGYATNRDVS
jgi:hypothetical protein